VDSCEEKGDLPLFCNCHVPLNQFSIILRLLLQTVSAAALAEEAVGAVLMDPAEDDEVALAAAAAGESLCFSELIFTFVDVVSTYTTLFPHMFSFRSPLLPLSPNSSAAAAATADGMAVVVDQALLATAAAAAASSAYAHPYEEDEEQPEEESEEQHHRHHHHHDDHHELPDLPAVDEPYDPNDPAHMLEDEKHDTLLAARRLKDRKRYATMSAIQRAAYNAHRRELYHKQGETARKRRRERERNRYHSLEGDDKKDRNARRAQLERDRYNKLSKEELEQRNAKRRERAKLRKQNAKGRQQQQQQQPQEMMPLMEPMQEAIPSLPEPDHDHFHEALDSHLVDSVRRAGAGAEQAMGGADYNHDAAEEISHV
jgi:hypothetical protein